MEIQIDTKKTYRLRIKFDKILTYTGLIISKDDNFIKFRDKFGTEITVRIEAILSYEEVKK